MKDKLKKTVRVLLSLALIAGLIFTAWLSYSNKNEKIYAEIARNYQGQEIERQMELVSELESVDAPTRRLGYLFIPKYPSQHPNVSYATLQHNVPYFNQNDPKWARKKYGTDGSQEVWENGCAIVSLAMVDSCFKGTEVSPVDVLKWAGDDYYSHGQGTKWSIFADYGADHGYEVIDCGNNFSMVEYGLDNGALAIVSVKPGMFTEVGHIMVIRGYQDFNVYINDPNDDPKKLYSIQPIHIDEFLDQVNNFWLFYPL